MEEVIEKLAHTIRTSYSRDHQPYRALALLLVEPRLVDREFTQGELKYIISKVAPEVTNEDFDNDYSFFMGITQ